MRMSPSTGFLAIPITIILITLTNQIITTAAEAKEEGKATEGRKSSSAASSASSSKDASQNHEEAIDQRDAVKGRSKISPESSRKRKRSLSVAKLRNYIDKYAEEFRKRANKKALASWEFATNITEENSKKDVAATLEISAWMRDQWKNNITTFDLSVLDEPGTEELKRLYSMVTVLGEAALDDEKLAQRTQCITAMEAIYSKAKVCPHDKQDCTLDKDGAWSLEPELTEVMREVTDKNSYDKLKYTWKKWRDASGKKMRQIFINYVKLSNEAAIANNDPKIKNAGDLWLHPYESDNFREEMAKLYGELKPFYHELHAFVRHKLVQHFGKEKIDAKGPLPAHIFGNMWAQSWDALYPIVSEFNAPSLDVTEEMKKKNFSVWKMFEVSDDFFTGLGLPGVETAAIDFYRDSMLEKPADGREVVCHASAWDFMATNKLPGDFRIKMCTDMNMEDLITIHHELGHIQYFMQYANLSPLFRNGANPGFHEAIGDTLALSASTTSHLKSIGLLDGSFELDKNAQLAFLLRTALTKIAFLPFGYLVDLYRWQVFDGSLSSDNLNAGWWKLRECYQGIEPPVPRTEQDFDPGAKYHVAADVPYISYFVAHILQFAFHQALSEAAGQFDPKNPEKQPLHTCNIEGSKAAGDKLKKLLQAGSSRHWKEALYDMTGSREMTVAPLLNYFKPLRDYLQDYILKNNVHVGWENAQ